jgi:hypothetical protein
LEERIGKRLVGTFRGTIQAILEHHHRNCGLLLSELGGLLLSPDHALAGTKRISKLLRCAKWTFEAIARFLWRQADARRNDLLEQQETVLVAWDETVNEKPERQKAEGSGPVRSSKANRNDACFMYSMYSASLNSIDGSEHFSPTHAFPHTSFPRVPTSAT